MSVKISRRTIIFATVTFVLLQITYFNMPWAADPILLQEKALTNYLINLDLNVSNPNNFDFSIEVSKSCQRHPNLAVLAVVHSAIPNIRKRHIIRRSWGRLHANNTYNILVRFFLGKSNFEATNRKVIEESRRFGDIVVQDFMDSYRNLTLKSMSWMKWIVKNCPQPRYVLKVDDDMMVDVFKFRKFIEKLDKENGTRESIFCKLRAKEPVLRHRNKWYVSKTEFFNSTYPNYCPGIAVIFDRLLIDKLNAASHHVPFFWIDDVYFTGLLRDFVGAKIVSISDKIGNLKSKNAIFELIQSDTTRKTRWAEILLRENSTWPID